LAALAAIFLALETLAPPMRAAAPTEYEVKAAYLYNFGRFVRWPAKSPAAESAEFNICVLGADPFGATLDATISGRVIDGKNVRARRISRTSDTDGCRVVFISSSQDNNLRTILTDLDSTGVLTVSDMPKFTDRGGMVQFITKHQRVRFAVNLAAAEHAGLALSSELLKVAVRISGEPLPRE
jgi:YfiR/HmsC-like